MYGRSEVKAKTHAAGTAWFEGDHDEHRRIKPRQRGQPDDDLPDKILRREMHSAPAHAEPPAEGDEREKGIYPAERTGLQAKANRIS